MKKRIKIVPIESLLIERINLSKYGKFKIENLDGITAVNEKGYKPNPYFLVLNNDYFKKENIIAVLSWYDKIIFFDDEDEAKTFLTALNAINNCNYNLGEY